MEGTCQIGLDSDDTLNPANGLPTAARATTEMNIPAQLAGLDVVRIADKAFTNESALTAVTFPSTLKAIADQAFSMCVGLTTIDIPSSVETIGECAFLNCTKVSAVNLRYGLKEIGPGAFEQLTNMRSVRLPATLTTLGIYAFGGWYSSFWERETIYSQTVDPLPIAEGDFYVDTTGGKTAKDITVYVPYGSLEAYKADAEWSKFTLVEYDYPCISRVDLTVDIPEAGDPIPTYDTAEVAKASNLNPAGTDRMELYNLHWENLGADEGDETDGIYLPNNCELFFWVNGTNHYFYPGVEVYVNGQKATLTSITLDNDPTYGPVYKYVMGYISFPVTGIDGVKKAAAARQDAWYTLDGRRLSGQPTQKGLYLHGGRKVAVK